LEYSNEPKAAALAKMLSPNYMHLRQLARGEGQLESGQANAGDGNHHVKGVDRQPVLVPSVEVDCSNRVLRNDDLLEAITMLDRGVP
jgi:hypothetical protein